MISLKENLLKMWIMKQLLHSQLCFGAIRQVLIMPYLQLHLLALERDFVQPLIHRLKEMPIYKLHIRRVY